MYRVFEALDELSAIVEEARGVPMTAGCVVPRGDVLELLDDIKDAIPGELDDAQDVLDARDGLLRLPSPVHVWRDGQKGLLESDSISFDVGPVVIPAKSAETPPAEKAGAEVIPTL